MVGKKKVRLNRSVIQNTFPEILRGNKSKNGIGVEHTGQPVVDVTNDYLAISRCLSSILAKNLKWKN